MIAFLAACGSHPPEDTNYEGKLAAARAAKDAEFATSSESPIPANLHDKFLPLGYFPIDPDYKAPAVLRPSGDATVFQMPTSTGANRAMRRAGTLEFTLKGQPLKLTAFNEVGSDPGRLFVPFSDLTTASETYNTGRFMDLDRNATGIYEIDFNRAYHPYCYYNPTWECPLPPRENRLQVPIRSGERYKVPPTVPRK